MRQTEAGWAMKRLLDIHAMIRHDLATLRRAVAAVAGGGPDGEAAAALRELSIQQPDW